MKIGDLTIGKDQKTIIIAELSANHDNSFETAIATIKAAKDSGADAVKLQTYTPDTITIDCDNEFFQIKHGTIWDGITLYQLYKRAYMPWDWQPRLKQYAESIGLICFSSPFDKTAVDFLETMDVPAYKIASFEITDIPLIEYVASKGKPVLISTGIATRSEITDAIEACTRVRNSNIILLKCTSSYPAKIDDANLSMIPVMEATFGCLIGLSDHTIGNTVAIGAVALGACIIEKHFILDKKLNSPDAKFSMEPKDFKQMVEQIRNMEKVKGKITFDLSQPVIENRRFARSLFVVKDIKEGSLFTDENIRSIRPGNGLSPKYLKIVIGKQAKIDIKRGTPLIRAHFE